MLQINIIRAIGENVQTRCVLNDKFLYEFYSFYENITDQEIDNIIHNDLITKGYQL